MKQLSNRIIRRKFMRQLERRRIASIKVALIRQRVAMKSVSLASTQSLVSNADSNFQMFSACSSPDSPSSSPVFHKLRKTPNSTSESQASTESRDFCQLPSALSDKFNQSQGICRPSNSPNTCSTVFQSRFDEDPLHDTSDLLNVSSSPHLAVTNQSRDLNNQSIKDTTRKQNELIDVSKKQPPITPSPTNTTSKLNSPSLEDEQKSKKSSFFWSDIQWNSAKQLKFRASPGKSVPLRKRKHSLDYVKQRAFNPAQTQTSPFLKQLKSATPVGDGAEDVMNISASHKIVMHSKSVPGNLNAQLDYQKLKQTARKSTRRLPNAFHNPHLPVQLDSSKNKALPCEEHRQQTSDLSPFGSNSSRKSTFSKPLSRAPPAGSISESASPLSASSRCVTDVSRPSVGRNMQTKCAKKSTARKTILNPY